ncbi:hypothetical protein KAI04_03920 [Candidatus Pacearchaeota archaeon]|nr:hypothetical protein [Candidatus Pacearchaeota archaeon]
MKKEKMSNKEQLIVTVMGDNCIKFIDMCFKSIIDADKIIFCWGKGDKKTLEIYNKWKKEYPNKFEIIQNKFIQDDPYMISKQRNFYLKYLKENYKGWYCLVLDADEVVDNLDEFKKFINNHKWEDTDIFSPRMRHLIGTLITEDNSKPIHYVPHRFFKITDDKFYPDTEHCFLISEQKLKSCPFNNGLIWHLGYLDNIWGIKQRYDGQMNRKKGNSHPEKFLKRWKNLLLFGEYPIKPFNPVELPDIILNNFGIEKDEIYFANRGLELKHFIDAIHWKEFFKCKSLLEFGCGRGPRIYALQNIGVIADGLEISEFAVENSIPSNGSVMTGDITKDISDYSIHDLTIAYDVLEHLEYKDLNKAIKNLTDYTNKYILISVPFEGTSNCDADPTHIIKEDKEWWIKQFTDKELELIPTPEHFQFKEQILIFKKK